MLSRTRTLILVIVTALTLTSSAGCGGSSEGENRALTGRERDSTIAASWLPGSKVVGRAIAVADSAESAAKRADVMFR